MTILTEGRTNVRRRRGQRLRVIATLGWWLTATVAYAVPIGSWMGFQVGLLQRTGSLQLATAEKQRLKSIVAACWAARRSTCAEPHNEYDLLLDQVMEERGSRREATGPSVPGSSPSGQTGASFAGRQLETSKGCEQAEQFVQALAREAAAHHVPAASEIEYGDACIDFYSMTIPEANWPLIIVLVLIPAIPFGLYGVGAWAFGQIASRGVASRAAIVAVMCLGFVCLWIAGGRGDAEPFTDSHWRLIGWGLLAFGGVTAWRTRFFHKRTSAGDSQ